MYRHRLYSDSHAERLMAPTVLDTIPFPDANITNSYRYQAACARAWWGFILHAYHTGDAREAWNLYEKETDSIVRMEETRYEDAIYDLEEQRIRDYDDGFIHDDDH